MLQVSVLCFLASYILAFGLEWTRLVSRGPAGRWLTVALGGAGFVAQTWYLLQRTQQTELPPLLSSMQDWLLVLAWVLVLVHMFVMLTDPDLATGLLTWPLAIGVIIASRFVSPTAGLAANAHRNWTMLHVAMLVLGMAGVAVGFLASLMYLWQHWRMKQRVTSAAGLGLPSLERLARVNRWSLLVSVPLLTIGMLSGVGLTWIQAKRPVSTVITDPIILASGLCWIVMAVLFVWLVRREKAASRKMALLTAWSCGFLLLTTVGAQILGEAIAGKSVHGTGVAPTATPGEEHSP